MRTIFVQTLFFAVVFLLAGLLELMAGSVGITLPLTLGAFYLLTPVLPWHQTGFWAIPAGMLLDFVFGRDFPVSVLALFALTAAAYPLRKRSVASVWELVGSMFGAAAAAEAVYAVFSGEFSFGIFLRWIFLSAQGGCILWVTLCLGRMAESALGIPSGFQSRGTLWKKRKKQIEFARGNFK